MHPISRDHTIHGLRFALRESGNAVVAVFAAVVHGTVVAGLAVGNKRKPEVSVESRVGLGVSGLGGKKEKLTKSVGFGAGAA